MTARKSPAGSGGASSPKTMSLAAEYSRRRAASARLERLACGCADPWSCLCRRPGLDPDAAAAADAHLRAAGFAPSWVRADLLDLWDSGYRGLAAHLAGAVSA
ncbi:hypothetical protein GOHSU_68_00070 [Gordonia hirsuta DSM 44140 = NBRC 16056]|uniref:Uncharacterized protein n=1 Tax=Gordonia hirsuta DSM 44140 = NBRC 16056 TaxID=1121927 RepID=L7LD26_9ACTN|nr:hypothetical protein GOHSU_68_00070 [Gordonia hirsuta DSM 44140 = NBRC 16056]